MRGALHFCEAHRETTEISNVELDRGKSHSYYGNNNSNTYDYYCHYNNKVNVTCRSKERVT